MRTTLAINDQLLEQAKRRAQAAGVTLGSFVEEALRRELATGRTGRRPVDLPVSRADGGAAPGVDLTSNRGLYDAMGSDVA
ncbi:MAG: hypothetical protein BGN97_10740 [Microbacterium sp. 69-10]|uniref:type II toxin-antitoxin system VapB family antitoxin n=1 Tax=Microbacterium sp. 69-10 TaxID=1895783 RepID=UPI00095D13E2|nr:type II toxin-antitoxin system VapB family antitoxin [Microbacterium sp. 69-10]OJU38795.1 MAG: hypothetical protein BGN97_10740 [Microbacterium sp. 69-10]